ncbi:hypothetical protein BSKO_07169 [Bryopsis sp. KO-2023]|nr:hypothetical protein BSKO_07169 [Bryopsis sp. KO-2023]
MNDGLPRSQLTLWLLVVVATSIRAVALTDARRLPANTESKLSRRSSRDLLGVYDVTACAWVEDAICELSPDYGRLLYSETDAPLQQLLFKRSDCFTSRLRGDCESIGALESDQYCTWNKEGGRCRYKTKNFGEDAEECSAPGMRKFNSLDARCKAFTHSNCPTKLGCTVTQIEGVGRACRPSGTEAVDRLLNSAINQADILRVLIKGAASMKDLSLPTIEEAQNATGEEDLEGGGRRRLTQSNLTFGGLQRESSKVRSSGVLSVSDARPLSVSGAGAQATDGQRSSATASTERFGLTVGDEGLGPTVTSLLPGPVIEITENVVEITEPPAPPKTPASAPKPQSPKPRPSSKPEPRASIVGDTKPASRAQKNKETGDSTDVTPPKSEKGDGTLATTNTRAKKTASLTAPQKQPGAKKAVGTTTFNIDSIPPIESEGREATGTKSPTSKPLSSTEGSTVVGEVDRDKSLSAAGATKNKTPAALDFSSGDDNQLIRNREQLQNLTTAEGGNENLRNRQNLEDGLTVSPSIFFKTQDLDLDKSGGGLLQEIVTIITNLSTVMSLKSVKLTGPSILEIQESLRIATLRLDNLRRSLDLNDFDGSERRYRQAADELWWKMEVGAQEGSKKLQGRELSRAIYSGGIKIMEAYFQANRTWPEEDLASYRGELDTSIKKLEDAIFQHQEILGAEVEIEQTMATEEIKELGDLVSLFMKFVNESFHEVYPIQLDLDFVEGYNQTWVRAVVARNQRWHDIRRTISNISNMGQQIQSLLLKTHLVLLEASPGDMDASAATEGLEGTGLENLVNDMVGALVAIYDGNYSLANPQPVPDDVSDKALDRWQAGPPISRDDLWGVIQNVTTHNSIGDFQKPIDELARILEAVVLMTEAKIYPRASEKIDLPPSPQESSIMLLLDNIQHLVYEWAFARNGKQRNIFGSFAHSREELDLSLAGCAGLGGINPESCSFDRTNCAVEKLPGWMLGDSKIQTQTDTFCWPRNVVSSRILDGMTEKTATSALLSDLLQASVVCVMRETEECRVDDLCEFSGIGDCQISSNFVQFVLQNVSIASLSAPSSDEACMRFLGLPTCHDFQDAKACQATHGCAWANSSPPNTTSSYYDLPLLTETETETETDEGNSTKTKETGHERSDVEELDGPGICLDDWVEQLVHVTEFVNEPQERQHLLHSKHEECLQQRSLSQCQKVDADAEDLRLLPSSVPRGSASISEWGPAVISVLGTVFMAAIALFAWKLVKRNRKRGAKGKKKGGKRGGKRTVGGGGGGRPGKPAGKKGKKLSSKPAVQMIRKPPTFTTVISPSAETSTNMKEANFAFVLGTISGSADSSSSNLKVPHSQDNQEINPVSESDGDTTDSSWTSTSTEGWTDSESEGEGYHRGQ